MRAYVRKDGCIRLGSSVTCDGFDPDVPMRIQSHIHHDHLKDFERSKGKQQILLTQATLELLIAEFNADSKFRNNLIVVDADTRFRTFDGVEVALFPSGHIVGGAMPVVRESDGMTFAYSSDFSWPLNQFPKDVDVLVVDSTYGDPSYIRNYSETDVIEALLASVRDEMRNGSILFTGHKGRLQAAAQLLHTDFKVPMILTRSVMKTFDVFQKYRGFQIIGIEFGSEEAARLLRTGERCFIFAEPHNRREIDQVNVARRVILSPYMVPLEKPVATYDSFVRVAYTDHADFKGTIDLVRAINPKYVITDNSRYGNAERLAEFIRSEMKIPATAETKSTSRLWGQG